MSRSPGLPVRRLCSVVLLCSCFASGGAAAPVAVSPVRPLQTELITPLDLGRVHVGSPVLVRVDLEWRGENCTLRVGSVVQGHVVGMVKRSKGVKDSSVELAFNAADCEAQHEAAFRFTLVAVVGAGRSSTGQSGVEEAAPLADAIGNSIGAPVVAYAAHRRLRRSTRASRFDRMRCHRAFCRAR